VLLATLKCLVKL